MVTLKRYPAGSIHPSHAIGTYTYNQSEEDRYKQELAHNIGVLALYRARYKTKEDWCTTGAPYVNQNGHKLNEVAWLYLWQEEENEFGPVSP